MPFIEATSVDKSYVVGTTRLPVLRDLSLSVDKGEMVAIVGASGVGKSTLLHVLGGLDALDAGTIRIGDADISSMRDADLTAFRNRHVGFVFQFHHLLPEFTALENVSMPQLIAGKGQGDANKRSHQLLDLLGVDNRASHRPAELSGGEQQRVAIARAAANHPQVILADEPTGNLDPATSDLVFAALQDLIRNEGAAGLIATHNHDLARRADRIVTLKDGLVQPLEL